MSNTNEREEVEDVEFLYGLELWLEAGEVEESGGDDEFELVVGEEGDEGDDSEGEAVVVLVFGEFGVLGK